MDMRCPHFGYDLAHILRLLADEHFGQHEAAAIDTPLLARDAGKGDERKRTMEIVPQDRRIGECINCGLEKPIAAFDLCYTCYRREGRQADRKFLDKHNPGVTRDQKRILSGYAKMLGGLGDMAVPRGTVLLICRMIKPWLVPVEQLLNPPPPCVETDAFASEREPNQPSTTH